MAIELVNADPLDRPLSNPWWSGPERDVSVGASIQHDGHNGTVMHLDNLSPGGWPVALIRWDDGELRG